MSRVRAEGERDCICARQKRVESEATELEIITSEEYGAWRTPRTAWGHWDWGMSGSAADSLAQVKRPPLSELPPEAAFPTSEEGTPPSAPRPPCWLHRLRRLELRQTGEARKGRGAARTRPGQPPGTLTAVEPPAASPACRASGRMTRGTSIPVKPPCGGGSVMEADWVKPS